MTLLSLLLALDVSAPAVVTPVAVEGRKTLVYELHLTKLNGALKAVRVVTAGSNNVVGRFGGEYLEKRVDRERAVVYLEFECCRSATALIHEVDTAEGTFRSGPTRVAAAAPIVIGPPLAGGPWVAIHHPDWPRGHRRVFVTADGQSRIPGRFAIDFVKLDKRARTAHGDADRTESAVGYGADVLAVAGARVAAVRDGMEESRQVSRNPKHALTDAPGNFVVLDLGGGRYAIYEHLRPGSIRVEPGDQVRRGDVIAALGFTGDSTGPHLHFHVADAPLPLAAEGVPFAIDRFTLLGRYEDIGTLGSAPWTPLNPAIAPSRRRERPAPNVVLHFRPRYTSAQTFAQSGHNPCVNSTSE